MSKTTQCICSCGCYFMAQMFDGQQAAKCPRCKELTGRRLTEGLKTKEKAAKVEQPSQTELIDRLNKMI